MRRRPHFKPKGWSGRAVRAFRRLGNRLLSAFIVYEGNLYPGSCPTNPHFGDQQVLVFDQRYGKRAQGYDASSLLFASQSERNQIGNQLVCWSGSGLSPPVCWKLDWANVTVRRVVNNHRDAGLPAIGDPECFSGHRWTESRAQVARKLGPIDLTERRGGGPGKDRKKPKGQVGSHIEIKFGGGNRPAAPLLAAVRGPENEDDPRSECVQSFPRLDRKSVV